MSIDNSEIKKLARKLLKEEIVYYLDVIKETEEYSVEVYVPGGRHSVIISPYSHGHNGGWLEYAFVHDNGLIDNVVGYLDAGEAFNMITKGHL